MPPYGTATLNLLTSSLAVFLEVKARTFLCGCEAWQGEEQLQCCEVQMCATKHFSQQQTAAEVLRAVSDQQSKRT